MFYRSSKETVVVLVMFLAGSLAAGDAMATNYVMTLNADGTFISPTTGSNYVHISEGDSVTFEGLERTDGIVQTNPLPAGTSDVCTQLLPKAYEAPGGVVDENEFTGPMRKGVSGIFVLGPMSKPTETESFKEYDLGPAPAPGTNACAPGHNPKFTVQDPNDSHYYQLCRDNGTSNQTMSVTVENPDIDGIIIRMNWKDIETSQGTFDYVRLDDEMDKAVKNGKMFTLDFRSGIHGMPDHEYIDHVPTPGFVIPLTFQTVQTTSITYPSCGPYYRFPSPSQQAYKDAYEDFIANVINHVRSNTAWWQALAHFKLSGVNLQTSEAKTAHLCDNDCWVNLGDTACATKIFAQAENISPGLGWSPDRLYQYYREVGNTIYEETLHQKSIGFQLIQNGYPRAIQPDNFYVDGGDDGDTSDDGDLPKFDAQTVGVLNRGQNGDFADRTGYSVDALAGLAFVPQHSGLQTNPDDTYQGKSGMTTCTYNQPIVNDPASDFDGIASFPLTAPWAWADLDGATSGCPNKWNRREGYQGQITGWQTNNLGGVADLNELSSALFSATTNSNGVFVEIYEELAWLSMHARGTGPSAAPLTDDPSATYYADRKNMHAWSEEMHTRRKWLADNDSTGSPFVEDPYPDSYTHTFSKNLAPGQKEIFRFISPYKCVNGGSSSMQRVGLIEVTGN